MHGLSLGKGLSPDAGLSFIHGLSFSGKGLSDLAGSVVFTVDFGQHVVTGNSSTVTKN